MTSPRLHSVPDHVLDAVGEMLERLESVTRAGQQHLMVKIVAALDQHPRALGRLDVLRREAAKTVPDGPTFARAAEHLLGALARSSR
jgi:hypothetical protein